jgi:hypothetical protein
MVKGFGTQTSVGVGEFTDGFDPANSSIANLAGAWSECTDLMGTWGFNVFTVADLSPGTMGPDDLLAALNNGGPAVLLHLYSGFPYGNHHEGLVFTENDAHAVVLTAVDTDNNFAAFNNPWGDKDQSWDLDVLLAKINADQDLGKTLGFWRS